MYRLSYKNILEILGYCPTKRHALEILGYEFSDRGRDQFKRERIDIEPALMAAISKDVSEWGVFPRHYAVRRPEVGIYLEKCKSSFVVLDKDKPSVWTKWSYPDLRSAARSLIRRVCDPGYLLEPKIAEEFTSVESSSD